MTLAKRSCHLLHSSPNGARFSSRALDSRGVTVLEILVVTAVVGLLVAFVVPAVQKAREVARRTQCAGHLREVGNAVHNFESARGALPFSQQLHRELLPYVGEPALYEELSEKLRVELPSSELAADKKVLLYSCPSDGASLRRASSSYAGCGSSTTGAILDGLFPMYGRLDPVRVSEVSDGMSNTVAMSEILVSDGMKERRRTIWELPPPALLVPDQLGVLRDLCMSLPERPAEYGWRGGEMRGWLWGASASYNHVLVPNRPSCQNGMSSTSVFSANSNHDGGVQVLMGDGAVRFESEDVDLSVWRDLASRGESMSSR